PFGYRGRDLVGRGDLAEPEEAGIVEAGPVDLVEAIRLEDRVVAADGTFGRGPVVHGADLCVDVLVPSVPFDSRIQADRAEGQARTAAELPGRLRVAVADLGRIRARDRIPAGVDTLWPRPAVAPRLEDGAVLVDLRVQDTTEVDVGDRVALTMLRARAAEDDPLIADVQDLVLHRGVLHVEVPREATPVHQPCVEPELVAPGPELAQVHDLVPGETDRRREFTVDDRVLRGAVVARVFDVHASAQEAQVETDLEL